MRGERLKEVRTRRGISQRKLAEHSDIAMRQIIRYEQNESEPNATQLIKLCMALSISSDYLLGLTDEEEEHFKGEELEEWQNEVVALIRKSTLIGITDAIGLLSKYLSDTAKREYPNLDAAVMKVGDRQYTLISPSGEPKVMKADSDLEHRDRIRSTLKVTPRQK